jgi:hypothetical protein
MDIRATAALSGKLFFQGAVASHAHLLRRLESLTGSLGVRLLLGSDEVLCGRDFSEAYDRMTERPALVSVVLDDELEQRLLFLEGYGPFCRPVVPFDWWANNAFAYRACQRNSWTVPSAVQARGRRDHAFLLFAVGENAEIMRSVGACGVAFYVEAVTANATAYEYIPAHVQHGPFKRQLALLALRDPKMWRLLPSSCDDVSAYLDALESRPAPRRASAEVWHTRAPLSLLVHMQDSHVTSCRDLVLRAVARCWRDLRYAAWNLRSDRAVVSAAVACHWRALQFASFELRGDRELLRGALEQNGLALCFASMALRADEGLARLAVRMQPRALQYVDLSLVAKWKRERAAGSDEVREEPPKG